MLCLHLKNSNPFFCLAAEEYLLKNYHDDIFLVWQSHNAIIIGKHQNALAEINYRFVRENNIMVARRISGGGTVFHDAGNVNFAFIKNVSSPEDISFRMFLEPVADFLRKLGVEAEISGRNDLILAGMKISGNAQHVYKNRVLHHGTLLFDSDLENLGNAIRVVAGKYAGKAIQSNRSVVTNIRKHLPRDMDTSAFIETLLDHQLSSLPENKNHSFSIPETETITRLANEKFSSWEWCFGYSPKYIFRNELKVDDKILKVELHIEKGIIAESLCTGNLPRVDEMNLALKDRRHRFEELYDALQLCFPDKAAELIYCFF